MAQVVIAGGGFAGLTASLFLARRGHAVTLVERDGPPPSGSADDDARWRRPGAPQSHQSHLILARARRVLVEEAPDVLDAMLQRGVREEPAVVGAGNATGEAALHSRRLVAEAVLRRSVDREPGVVVRAGDAVVGLAATTCGDVSVVTGVHTRRGHLLPADLVVDAGGRRSALPAWLATIGTRPPVDEVQQCGFFYLTRYYRLRPGCERPATPTPTSHVLDYALAVVFAADNDTFSVSMALSVNDPARHAMRDPERFERTLRAIPATAAWLGVGEPISGISMMARIENRRRRLVDDRGPIVGGVVSIGDAAQHTNPTLGRGISLALAHAQHLSQVVDDHTRHPREFVAAFDAWTEAHLGVWFDTQVASDRAAIERLEAGVRGERVPLDGPAERFRAAAFACAQHDPIVGSALARMTQLLDPPAHTLGDCRVVERVNAFLANGPDLERPPDCLPRHEFERLAGTRDI